MAYDYVEQNSWTPSLAFGGSSTGVTYTTQQGSYMLVGNVLIAQYFLVLSSLGSSSGIATITGLPYTCTSSGNFYNSDLAISKGTFTSNYFQWMHGVLLSTNYVSLFQTSSGQPIITASKTNLSSTGTIQGELFYFI